MTFNLRSYTRNILCFITMLLLFSLPTFAQSVKPRQANKPTAAQQDKKLTADNLEKESYRIWLTWHRARKQGKELPIPRLNVPTGLGEKEVDRVLTIWEQAQRRAHLAVEEEAMYKIWLDWYQAKEQGAQDPLPTLNSPSGASVREINQAQALWHKAESRARLTLERHAKNASKSINASQAQQASNSHLPFPNNNTAKASSPQAKNNSQSMVGVIAQSSNPIQAINYNSVAAQNNRILAEIEADIAKAKTGDNNLKIHLNNSPSGQTNISPASTHGFQVVKRYSYGSGTGPISQQQLINGQWVTSFFIYDGQGNVRALTDEQGNVTDTFDYDAFGNLISRTGTTPNTRLFAGEEFDQDLGFYYLRARFLDTVKGRFISQDEEEGNNDDPQSLHKYTYANNNPISNSDPSGKSTIVTAQLGVQFSNIFAAIPGFPTNLLIQRGGEGRPKSIRDELCDIKLAKLFGGYGAIAAGSGYDVPTLNYRKNFVTNYKFDDHLYKYLHIYGNDKGTAITDVYLPSGGKYIAPFGKDDGHIFFYENLEDLKNVTLLASHISNFVPIVNKRRPIEKNPFPIFNLYNFVRIGSIGGAGGGPVGYLHAHLNLTFDSPRNVKFTGSGGVKNPIPFSTVFCK